MDDEMLSCVHGYHIYYTPFGICAQEKCSVSLCCEADGHNLHDQLAVSVKKYDITISHIPGRFFACALYYMVRFASCHDDLAENSTSLNVHK